MCGVKLRIGTRIRHALERGDPVVALESTVITHGLPRPENLHLANALEAEIRRGGAEPATVGVLEGELVVGLTPDEVRELDAGGATKASTWNIAAILASGASAGTTVATTLLAAEAAGIRVFATGGIGGVHPRPFDESADLQALARHAAITVSAGPKSILDVAATVERLETLGVPVVGYGTDRVAGFHVPETDLPAGCRADTPREIADIFRAHRALGLSGGILVTKPVSEGLTAEALRVWLDRAEHEAVEEATRGKDTTPFLLARLAELSAGATVDVNVRLLRENARLAAEIACALRKEDVTAPPFSGALQ